MYGNLSHWFRLHGKLFWLSAFICAGLVISLGWFSDIKSVAHVGLLGVLGVAFLPFVVLIGAALVALVFGLVIFLPLSLLGDGADIMVPDLSGLDIGDAGLTEGYYKFLGKQRHPVFWGIPSGIMMGALALLLLTYPLIIRKEAATVDLLAKYEFELQTYISAFGRYPEPTPQGHLLFPEMGTDQPAVDGFGRPLLYTVDSKTPAPSEAEKEGDESEEQGLFDKLKASAEEMKASVTRKFSGSSYTLSSQGFDLDNPDDDLCISGRSGLLEDVQNFLSKPFSIGKYQLQYQAVLGLRCDQEKGSFHIDAQ